ncbi:hypothetical protein LTR66_016356, partial [Elasticomyces elasticus]
GVGRQVLAPRDGATVDKSDARDGGRAIGNGDESRQKDRENGIPVVFLYGENDWMDIAGGYAAERKLRDAQAAVLAASSSSSSSPSYSSSAAGGSGSEEQPRGRDNGDVKVLVIARAGHHVYLDGVDQFNRVVVEEMRDVEGRERRLGLGRGRG